MRHLNKSGFQAYLVGGAVRDMLLEKLPKDFDIATDATPEEIRRLFRNARIIGRRFRIVHVLFGQEVIEVTTFRGHHNAEETAGGSKQASMTNDHGMLLRDNVYGSVEEDALRRDFTINALYYSLEDFCVYDFVNGMDDIKHKRLRLIGDPAIRFKEDPVRMLRALRFTAKLGFSIDEATLAEIDTHAELLNLIPPARLFDEFSKLFITGHAVETYIQLKQHGLLGYLLSSHHALVENPVYEALAHQAFINTDLRLKSGKSVTPGFIFAVLLWPSFCQARQHLEQQNMPAFTAIHAAAEQVMQAQGRHTAMPKYVQSTVKDIWELQERLTQRQGKRAFKAFEHPRFRAGYDFLLLREQVQEIPPGLGEWWTQFQLQDDNERVSTAHDAPPEAGSPRKTRKRKARRKE